MSAPRSTGRKGPRPAMFLVLPIAFGLAFAGCRQTDGTPLSVRFNPGGAISVTVSDESGRTTPTYDWTGERASSLTVRAVDSGAIFWRLRVADGSGGFAGPVRHGIVPLEAELVAQHRILEPGVEYQILVVGMNGLEGRTTFVP